MASGGQRDDTTDATETMPLGADESAGWSREHGASAGPPWSDSAVDPSLAALKELSFEERYEVRSLLGQGGMGEVFGATDHRIGRDVALKKMREDRRSSAHLRDRFLREACVQGQLEHPGIVPVYDLGVSKEGEVFFTMKEIQGETLGAVLRRLAEGQEEPRFSRNRLLSIFADICEAVGFAHRHGVVHRDLKPANIMLGEFGEVYVIDWGLAALLRVPGDAGPEIVTGEEGASIVAGTPAYLAPEQAAGAAADPAADVYSLGAILFELLTLERFRQQITGETEDQPAETLALTPALRSPSRNIPPELDAICARAVRLDPGDRFPSARELAAAVRAFLDGDRDVELRKKLAAAHRLRGEELVERALEKRPEREAQDRAAAMQELGRALALTPDDEAAARAMARLLLEPPSQLPASTQEAQERTRSASKRTARRAAPIALVLLGAALPLAYWSGIREPWMFVLAGLAALTPALGSRPTGRPGEMSDSKAMIIFSCIVLSAVVATRLFGPLLVAPSLAASIMLPFYLNARPNRRWIFLTMACASFLVPFFAERAGLLSGGDTIAGGAFCIAPRAIDFSSTPATLLLLLFAISAPLTVALFAGRLIDLLRAAEQRLELQAWHLSHLSSGLTKERPES